MLQGLGDDGVVDRSRRSLLPRGVGSGDQDVSAHGHRRLNERQHHRQVWLLADGPARVASEDREAATGGGDGPVAVDLDARGLAGVLAQPLTLANAPSVCASPSSGVVFGSSRPPPRGLRVDPPSDRLCHRTRPDSRGLYRVRRGGRTQKVIAVEVSVATVSGSPVQTRAVLRGRRFARGPSPARHLGRRTRTAPTVRPPRWRCLRS